MGTVAGLILFGSLLVASSATSAAALPPPRWLQGCSVDHVQVDTTGADSEVAVFDSRGVGQTVLVQDTVVTGVTVWRIPNQYLFSAKARLFVKGVNQATGRPLQNDFYVGPLNVTPPGGDGIHPIPWAFPIDPPVTLPGPGKYFFLINDAGCVASITWLLVTSKNPYTDGNLWETGVSTCDSTGSGGPASNPDSRDLVFDITFCTDSVPVLNTSWGRLKEHYK
jgi:hypothetical protein